MSDIKLNGLNFADEMDDSELGNLLLQFQAYVKSGRINVHGEVVLSIAVPYEDKYQALPLTDIRGVMFVMRVYEPPGVETGDDLDNLMDIEKALDEVPDINPQTKGQDKVSHKLRLVQLDYDPFKMDDEEGEWD